MSLMEMFSNPEQIENLSMGDKLLGGLITTVIGISITFIVLLLLWIIIAVVSKVIASTEKKESSPTPAPAPAAAVQAPVEETVDDGQLIAVITATIAAMEGEGAMSNLIVKRISRISGSAPTWSVAGRAEVIESRR